MLKFLLLATLAMMTPLVVSAQNTPGSHFIENWDLDGNGSVSLKEITQRRGDVFGMFDQNRNGHLDAAEYVLFNETRAADNAERPHTALNKRTPDDAFFDTEQSQKAA